MSILSGLLQSEIKSLLAKAGPEVAKVEALLASAKAGVAPLAALTPAEQESAVQVLFPKLTTAEVTQVVTSAAQLLQAVEAVMAIIAVLK